MAQDLDHTVREMLVSETFEAHELVPVLTAKGHPESEVRIALARAQSSIAQQENDPAHLAGVARRGRAAHMVRFGVLWLAIGVPATFVLGGGLLPMMLAFAIGAAILMGGMRGLRRG